jgi:hypothetical protein
MAGTDKIERETSDNDMGWKKIHRETTQSERGGQNAVPRRANIATGTGKFCVASGRFLPNLEDTGTDVDLARDLLRLRALAKVHDRKG